MALNPAIDNALTIMFSRLKVILSPLVPLLKRYYCCIGILIALPLTLFLVLVSSSIFHWWYFPWSNQITLWLFRVMTLGAIVDALVYGVASLLFFLIWWRNKLRVSEQKRLRMAISYLLTPLFYGLIAVWGVMFLWGHMDSTLAYLALGVFMLMSVSTIALGFLSGFTKNRKPVVL